jgi:hypothetical protein
MTLIRSTEPISFVLILTADQAKGAWGGSGQECGGGCELTVVAPESSPERSRREALVHSFRRGEGQSEEQLKGKHTKVLAELRWVTR